MFVKRSSRYRSASLIQINLTKLDIFRPHSKAFWLGCLPWSCLYGLLALVGVHELELCLHAGVLTLLQALEPVVVA